MKYIDVVISTKSDHVDNFFTYSTEDSDIEIGAKVSVTFAKGKSKQTGYVFKIYDSLPEKLQEKNVKIRKIIEIDKELSLDKKSVEICKWMRNRYYCRYIDAVNCFTPSGKPSATGKKRIPDKDEHEKDDSPAYLTNEQRKASEIILPAINEEKFKVFLLQGVTGSGKTEVYLDSAAKTIDKGRQVIMLVPEISLTHQTVARFIKRFGHERIAILHSKLTAGERFDEWMRIKKGEVDIVIGARSAVFAPFENIGIIIVDEEHEGTYKSDMSPKYDAIEVAIRRAKVSNATVILGSATPSVISSYRAEQGLYQKILISKRYNVTPLPILKVVNMRDELINGNNEMFSKELYSNMIDTLDAGKQVMLFLNRRGYSSFVSCKHCGYVMKCEKCNLSLTYHKAEKSAVCHFCGARHDVPKVCPSCSSEKLAFFGIGTEQIEEYTKKLFPDKNVARMDVDTTKTKNSAQKILKNFASGKTDILIGTQMIAKGLDFEHVNLVGVVAADVTLNIPDFKSPERTYQLITQVAGRAGRRIDQGLVIVQTFSPENYAIESASKYDYEGFYRTELFFRKELKYPPFSDIVQITVFSANEKTAQSGAERIKDELITQMGKDEANQILGPKPAPIKKIDNDYRMQLYIKVDIDKRHIYEKALFVIKRKINTDNSLGYRIIVDVNPYSLM